MILTGELGDAEWGRQESHLAGRNQMSAEATGSHRPYETDDRMVRLTPAAEPEAQELGSSNTRSRIVGAIFHLCILNYSNI
jgi:hypothetical protein